MRTQANKNTNAGMTMIEIMISTGLLVAVMISVGTLVVRAYAP